MGESVAVAKEADAKKSSSPTRSSNSIHRVQNDHEMQLGSLGGVIGNIRSNGSKPSVESIAMQMSGMPTGERAPALLALQQTRGNRYVQRVVSGIQAKLVVGQIGDKYEQEADRVADEVMRMPEVQPKPTSPPPQGPSCGDEDMEGELIQTRPIAEKITPIVQRKKEPQEQAQEITPEQDSRIQSLRGGGKLLPESTRAFFEPRFGHDFSDVRVHTGVNATKIAESIYARAFTIGNDIMFGHGQYSAGTDKGRRLLGHELTHVIQQNKSGFMSGYSRGSISEVSKIRTESIQREIDPHPEISGNFIIRVTPGINDVSAFISQVSEDLETKVIPTRVPSLMLIDGFRDQLEICWNAVLSLQRPGRRQITVRLEGWGGTVSRFILITPQVEIPEESRGQSESMLPALEESQPILQGMLVQRMEPCLPALYPSDPVPSGWKAYQGDTCWFHCCYRGILEDRPPSPDVPQNECFYDDNGTLVDEHHENSGCRGTPNQYDSASDWLWHLLVDEGGIRSRGWGAYWSSRWHDLNQQFEREERRRMECHEMCSQQPRNLRRFCIEGCSPYTRLDFL